MRRMRAATMSMPATGDTDVEAAHTLVRLAVTATAAGDHAMASAYNAKAASQVIETGGCGSWAWTLRRHGITDEKRPISLIGGAAGAAAILLKGGRGGVRKALDEACELLWLQRQWWYWGAHRQW